jgi:hypothetical protein
MYRIDCPAPQELGEYQLGMLPAEQAGAVAQHLAECPHCTREVAQLEDYLADLAPDLELSPLEHARERVRVLIARLVSGGLEGSLLAQPTLAPAYAGLRGEEGEPIIYEADQVQVVIEVHDDPDRPDRMTILGLVLGLDEPASAEVHLWGADQRLASVSVEETANFVFPDLVPGHYELILSGPDLEIHIQDVEVGTR